jgi:hypothetical protein
MLGSKSIMCGPAGPLVAFLWTSVKLTQAPPVVVGVSAPERFATSNSQIPVVVVARRPEVGVVVPG